MVLDGEVFYWGTATQSSKFHEMGITCITRAFNLCPQLFDHATFYPPSHAIGGEMTWAIPPYVTSWC